MNKKKNFITSVVLQIVTMMSGLILPRLIIITFGSEINGVVSSITQFLSFISLLEGGLGAVVLAELYKPIENHDDERIIDILNSCQYFFSHLALVFLFYTAIVSVGFGYFFKMRFGFGFICSLVLILSFSTLIQFLFAITMKLLLQAQQKLYIVNIVSTCIIIINLLISLLLIFVYPQIHIIKLFSSLLFLIQPFVFSRFIDARYKKKNINTKNNCLKNRWDGFAQNLAHFVNLNTDVVIITILLSFADVSVYTIYLLPITALRSIIASITNGFQSALGKYYAQDDYKILKKSFDNFEKFNKIVTLILFSTCILLINPFVELYTSGITDANYNQPIFALIIIIANMFYCIREPYRLLILAAGKFKETNFGAIMEAALNISVSLALVEKFGLIGIAVGTLLAILYRFIYFVSYLKKNILYKKISEYFIDSIKIVVFLTINTLIFFNIQISINNYYYFALYGAVILFVEGLFVCLLNIGTIVRMYLKIKNVK